MPTVRAIRTWLEQRSPADLRPAAGAERDAVVERVRPVPVALYRSLYAEVGGPWRWGERVGWSDARLAAHLERQEVDVFLLRLPGHPAPAGFAETERHPDGSVEIVYFGLAAPYMGRGLGGQFLTAVCDSAWRGGAARLWLHTCTLDAPQALPNYLARGFTITRSEEFDEVVP